MNNKKIAIVAVLAVVVTMMVGYALFSETVTINGTATAKGDFGITTTCQTGIPSIITPAPAGYNKDNGYENDSCSVVGNKVSFQTGLKYPGAERSFTIMVKNTGSINAVLAPQEDVTGFEMGIYKSSSINICEVNESGETSNCSNSMTWGTGSGIIPVSDNVLGVSDSNGTFYDVENEGFGNFMNETGGLVLKPGETIYLAMQFYWPEQYTSATNSASYKYDLTAEIPFVQEQ